MASKPKTKMPKEERAKQFMPFAALKGLDEALAAKEKIVVERKELSEEQLAELDAQMQRVEKGSMVTVVYYDRAEYIRKTGIVARIDKDAHLLQIVNTKIRFEDMIDLSTDDVR